MYVVITQNDIKLYNLKTLFFVFRETKPNWLPNAKQHIVSTTNDRNKQLYEIMNSKKNNNSNCILIIINLTSINYTD